jgi:NADPH-dependent 7-cyano-7-deazaguanine reductase QueF
MNKIDYKPRHDILIKIKKIRPFVNVCKVTKKEEYINCEISYIPNEAVIEIGSLRKRLANGFKDYVEEIPQLIYDEIETLVKPKKLWVKVYMEDPYLSDWSVEVMK